MVANGCRDSSDSRPQGVFWAGLPVAAAGPWLGGKRSDQAQLGEDVELFPQVFGGDIGLLS